MKRKAAAASQIAALARKKQRTSSESQNSLCADIEAVPTSSASLPLAPGNAGVNDGARPSSSVAGPTSGTEGQGESVTGGEPSPNPEKNPAGAEGTDCEQGENSADSAPRTQQEIIGSFAEDWLDTLDKEDIRSLSLFLCYHLVDLLSFTETKAAEFAALMVKKSNRSVRRWRSGLIENGGVLPESRQGRYQRSGVLWENEDLNKNATEYVRENAAVKGRPNLTTVDFCKWVNESHLPNSTLEPGFPHKIGLETARLWLHHLCFEVLTVRKGIY